MLCVHQNYDGILNGKSLNESNPGQRLAELGRILNPILLPSTGYRKRQNSLQSVVISANCRRWQELHWVEHLSSLASPIAQDSQRLVTYIQGPLQNLNRSIKCFLNVLIQKKCIQPILKFRLHSILWEISDDKCLNLSHTREQIQSFPLLGLRIYYM